MRITVEIINGIADVLSSVKAVGVCIVNERNHFAVLLVGVKKVSVPRPSAKEEH